MKTFFTSDTHYNHKNIIQYSNRPFVGMQDMEDAMVERWNSVVTPDDLVWHLGDFAMGPDLCQEVTRIRKRLNGRIHLILGNHDRSVTFHERCGFDYVGREFKGNVDGYYVSMRHHPPARPTGAEAEFELILHGHVHEKYRHRGKLVNVGVDKWNFTPHTIDEMITVINLETPQQFPEEV